ncbi:MAG: tRNA pseudouridine(38-40) synthase TruA [Bdellovibrionaceae bacterium]|nr:tRNA pseudouridine(38-40) synthase TruA [Pseudobdellovibrionaceae bacterium]
MRYRIHISYDGTDYLGWQKQPEGRTVQGAIENALKLLLKNDISTQGSGRTDAGVHALDQVAHFDYDGDLARFDMVRGLNRFLPSAVVVREAYRCPDDFHCLRDAESKTYLYRVLNTPTPNPLKTRYGYWVRSKVDLDYLNQITQPLLGEHDFKAFQTSGTELKTTVRHIFEAQWSPSPQDDEEVLFLIRGNGFLKQMVRNIVGTLLDGHWERRHSPESIRSILSSKDRQIAGSTAPAQGLTLFKVNYPENLDNKCLKL